MTGSNRKMGMLEAIKVRFWILQKPGFHGACIFCNFMPRAFFIVPLVKWIGLGRPGVVCR